ncbi:DUF1810 domain-containing protein [Inhella gelatinilytica]|uniref:DUF1810 domain-containing protein n=1 Tax=Inhella gelatinilytica TaxID=2795030 RepID=A0A931IXH2_9BURK|nr:DUF1810 domain-containing protein [Inhella gelatinilytica]MBH9553974.1 DUF1810 domain-containing protein [Inhella gelatinilytica]
MAEIRAGRKQTHWMWFVFPQIDGLGFSTTARYYALGDLEAARAFLDHPVLGVRLLACMDALMRHRGRSAFEIFGSPDNLKLHSCTTLFAQVAGPGSVFHAVLDRYFSGRLDTQTLQILKLPMPR